MQPKQLQALQPNVMEQTPHRDLRFQHPTAFTTTKYLINDEFSELLGLSEPVTRKNARLKAMLGADTIHPKNLFKYLRKMLVPIQRPLTDADVEKIRIKSQMKRAEMRMRKSMQTQNQTNSNATYQPQVPYSKPKYAQGSCISELQMELKKEIEQAEADEQNYGAIKLDLTANFGDSQKDNQAKSKSKKGNSQKSFSGQISNQNSHMGGVVEDNQLSIDDLLNNEDKDQDYSVLFKR
ncbi:UNKNOWN [Stylonychia lemnae]|uniref:Uncharacterized protein n=1 Tax=Stylonychia lemnae TaxID=5949 RepID=A0A078A1S3_STYLE|nr:UNKNOWN [Stylonychia lemnae]|eukprot:CDW76065.1 UNKNOWN [Stylonychia lemnae]